MTRRTLLQRGLAALSSTVITSIGCRGGNHQAAENAIELVFHGMFAFVFTQGASGGVAVYAPTVDSHSYGLGLLGSESFSSTGQISVNYADIGKNTSLPLDKSVFPTLNCVATIAPAQNPYVYYWCQLPLPDKISGCRRVAATIGGKKISDEKPKTIPLITRFRYNATAKSSLTVQGVPFKTRDRVHFRAEPVLATEDGLVFSSHSPRETHLDVAVDKLRMMLGFTAQDVSVSASSKASEPMGGEDELSREELLSLDELHCSGANPQNPNYCNDRAQSKGSHPAHCFSLYASN